MRFFQRRRSPLDNYGLRSGEVEVFPKGQQVIDSKGNTLAAKDSLALHETSLLALERQENNGGDDVFLDDPVDPMEQQQLQQQHHHQTRQLQHDPTIDSIHDDEGRQKRKTFAVRLLLVIMVLLAIILGTILTRPNRNQKPESNVASGVQMADNNGRTSAPSQSPTSILESTIEYQLLAPYVNPPSLLLDPQSPQGKAFQQIFSEQINQDLEFRIKQRFAMMASYYAMGGQNWTWQPGWNVFSENECDWYGVAICRFDNGRKVAAGFRIASNNAVGTLPEEICLLESLETIVLEGNQLTGTLPQCLTGLVSAFEFNFRQNEFSGTPPSGFLSMPLLETLDLSTNQFTGELDFLATNAMNSSRLKTLRLNNNGFNGEFPSDLYALNSLQELTLHGTLITGDVSAVCDGPAMTILTTNCSQVTCNSDCCECL